MDLKTIIDAGRELVYEAASSAKEKEVQKKVLKAGGVIVKKTAHTAGVLGNKAAKKTMEYVANANPESKEARILELEREVEAKDKEIKNLKRKLAKKSWSRL